VAQRDSDREHARPLPRRNAIEIANQLREQIVGIEFVDDQLQKPARPRQLRRTYGEESQRTRTTLLAPSLGVVLLFGSGGFFEVAVDVDDRVTDLAHGCTSTNHGHARRSIACRQLRRAWAARAASGV